MTDDTGAVTDRYQYTAFGELSEHVGSDVQPFQFVGESFDPKVGFYYNRARWLDVSVGRFVSMDPFVGLFRDPVSLHRYLYANANPINFIDPSGLTSVTSLSVTAAITNFITTSLRFLQIGFRILKAVDTIRTLIDAVTFGRALLRAISASTPAAAAAAMIAEIGATAGPDAVAKFTEGLSRASGKIGRNWESFASRIAAHSPVIAQRATPEVMRMIPKATRQRAQGKLRAILYFPTGPGRRKDTTVNLNRKWAINTGVSGGRLFGLGFKYPGGAEPQIFRVDYWEKRQLDLHFHIGGGQGEPIP